MGEQEMKNGKNLVVGDWIDYKLEKVFALLWKNIK